MDANYHFSNIIGVSDAITVVGWGSAPTYRGFTPEALEMLLRYPWPGNVRELRSAIRRACALAGEGERIQTHHLPSQMLTENS